MIDTVVCYLEKDEKILMLHRVKKSVDINKNKWIGVGGKIEKNETPMNAALREFKEEAGLDILDMKERGFVLFKQDGKLELGMHIFTASDFNGHIIECNEGNLKWIDKKDVMNINLWEGDRLFMNLLFNNIKEYFEMEFIYENDVLKEYRRIK